MRDENYQPYSVEMNMPMLNDRTIDELTGIAKGVVADGLVNQQEAVFLLDWLKRNAKYARDRIVVTLLGRIEEMLSDGILDNEEKKELFEILKSITGEQIPAETVELLSATFPLDKPAPPIIFEGKHFCFTGKFAYGPRKICEQAITERGGNMKTSISDWVDYLIIGNFSSEQWQHTTYGRKIEAAMLFRDQRKRTYGNQIAIIHEDHWAKYL